MPILKLVEVSATFVHAVLASNALETELGELCLRQAWWTCVISIDRTAFDLSSCGAFQVTASAGATGRESAQRLRRGISV